MPRSSIRQDRCAGEQRGLLQQEGRHRHDVRGMDRPDRRDPGGAFLFTKYACQAMIAARRRQRHQYRLDRRASGRAQQHRLFDRQVRPAELHPLGRDGAGRARHPRQQPDADRDRSQPSSSNAPRAGAARSEAGKHRSRHEAVPRRHSDAEAAAADRLCAGRGVPRQRRCLDDHRHRPARRRRRDRALLGMGPEGGGSFSLPPTLRLDEG